MSSPDHPTSNMEDAFSSNFPNYLPPASPDYILTSPGKTYSSSSNSFGIVPTALPSLLLFHDDPYMKVLQAFYTEKSPNMPQTIIPPNPQGFFLPEGLLSPKKQVQSSSSTSSLPQIFKIGESSRKTSIERHEEQIKEILNHLRELSLDRIEHIEDKVEATWLRQIMSARSLLPEDMIMKKKNALRSGTMYDVADDMWTPLPDMADERDECKGVFHRGKFYVVSGYDMAKQGQFKKSAEAFDLFTWQWCLREDDFSRDDMCPRTCVDGGEG
ncbi:reverse transcriptase domain-containing protein [Tanacetum coccineum]|uniref:Reverse transcriptase domain-containing protein n=1 Tax=Tanacetum coccineum TaxID=301880 RepID=A0ABQ5ACM1_9ASTR